MWSTEVTEVTDAKTEALRLPRRRRLDCHRRLVRSTEVTEVTDAKANGLRVPRRSQRDLHRQLLQVMAEVRSTEMTEVTEAKMEALRLPLRRRLDCRGGGASTATVDCCRCRKRSCFDGGRTGGRRRDRGASTADAVTPRLPPPAVGGDDGCAIDRGDGGGWQTQTVSR